MIYEKNVWAKNDKVVSSKLNNIENGLDLLNPLIVHFEFDPEQQGVASVDKTFAEIEAAHAAGRRVYLSGYVEVGVAVLTEINTFVYESGDLTAWTAVATINTQSGPAGIYIISSMDDETAGFDIMYKPSNDNSEPETEPVVE